MQKKPKRETFRLNSGISKKLLTMKMLLFLIMLSAINVSGNIYSQNVSLSASGPETTVKDVLKDIERQSQYRFLYNDDFSELKRTVRLSSTDYSIDQVLDELLVQGDLSYRVLENNLIVITPSDLSAEMQQDHEVTGVVTGPDGETLPGVNVLVDGTTVGVVSDTDGRYRLTVPDPNSVLIFSFVGFERRVVPVEGRSVIDVVLEVEVAALEEIVVVGYGTRMREELTGSISTLSAERMERMTTSPTAIGRLQGQVSGVTVTTSNVPGGAARIRVRGLGTITDNEPLYIIDGVPANPGQDLNPNDIESISVLKDASSAAIYGTRGANGVIIITTKRGTERQKPTVSFNARVGVSQAINQYDLLNTQEMGELQWLVARNRGLNPGVDWTDPIYGGGTEPRVPDYISPAGAMEGDPGTDPDLYNYPGYMIIRANREGTDWYDEIYRNGLVQEYDLSLRGGGENATYAFSGSYLNEEGYLLYTGFERFTFRGNVDGQVTNWLRTGQSIQVSHRESRGALGDQGEATVISHAYRSQPIIPVYDIMGNYAGGRPLGTNSSNPVAVLDRSQHNGGDYTRIIGNAYAEANIIEGLEFRSTLGYNYGVWNGLSRGLPNPEHAEPTSTRTLGVSNNNTFQWNWSNVVNFATTIGDDHRINVIAGTEAVDSRYRWNNAGRAGFFSDAYEYMQLSAGEFNQTNSGSYTEWSLFSIFGRANYDFRGKYLFEATIRRDGSSRFGPENRYANFPAASFAWAISQEDFMEGTRNWLDFLKLRLGWGISGNDRIGNYVPYSTYATHLTLSSYPIDGSNTSVVTGFRQSVMGNPSVTWETTETMNLGLDITVLDNTLNFTADVWQRYTSDMLYQLRVPHLLGVATPPFVNIGEMKNVGFDLELGYNNTAMGGQFRYGATATISRYVNEIMKLSDDVEEEIIMGSLRGMPYNRATVGTSFPQFYGYIADGFFMSQEEADAHPPAFGEEGTYNRPGRIRYRDVNGDGVITTDDRTYIGSPHPDFTGGLNVDLGYRNFDINMFFYGSYGNDMINYVRRWIDMGMYNGGRSMDALYRSWGSPYLDSNEDAVLPILDNEVGSEQPSTFYIEDGSFLRLKNLRVNYSVPQSILGRIQAQNLRIYAQISNVFTITNYSGLDPEMDSGVTTMGLDQGAWPTPRQIMFGVTIGL